MKHPRKRLISGVVALIVLFFVGCATVPNEAPKAAFTIDSGTGTTAHSFAFDAGSSSDPEDTALSFAWDFGDNTVAATGETVAHLFATPGTYVVELTVTDAGGKAGKTEQTVLVSHTLTGSSSEFTELLTEMNELAAAMSTDPVFLALKSFPLGSVWSVSNLAELVLPGGLLRPEETLQSLLPSVVDRPLWTGEFEWDPVGGFWIPGAANTENILILRWDFDGASTTETAELTLDWDAGLPTKEVVDWLGLMFEVPVSMSAKLSIDGAAAGDLVLDFSWYDEPPCQAILEPTAVAVSGNIGLNSVLTIGDASSAPVLPAEIAIVDNPSGDDELTTHGAAGFSWGADSDSVTGSWDASVLGLISRFDTGGSEACFIDLANTTVDSATLDLDVVSDVAGKRTAFHLVANLTDVDLDLTDVTLTDVDLTTLVGDVAGSLEIDGIETLTLSGTLEDSDADFVPDIVLTDVDGNMQSLAEFLESLDPDMAASLLRAIQMR